MSYCADKYTSQFGGMTNQYAYYHEDDESTFQLVDTAKPQKPVYQRGRRMFNQV
jgi:translation initiation factor 3 subunit D